MNSAPSTSVIPFVRRLTPKAVAEIMGVNLMTLQRPVPPRNLYDLFGVVMGATIKKDKTGTKQDSVQFKGQFQAVDCDTAEVLCESGIAFIPVMDGVLYSAMNSALEKDPKAQIAIAFRVGYKTAPSDKPSITGYEWDVQRLIPQEHSEDSPIERLKKAAKQHSLALAAPGPASGNAAAAAQGPAGIDNGSAESHKRRAGAKA